VTPRPVLGIVTIGQTPRPDLAATFAAAAPDATVRVAGALDGLGGDEIAALAVPGPYPLLVRLADGSTAEVPRDTLVPRVAAAAAALADGGATLVVVACAGTFPAFPCAAPLLVPGRVVPATVRAIAAGGRIGIVTPNAAQAPFAEAKWRADGFDVAVTHAAPSRTDELEAAAVRLRAAAVTLVVLDCMGHDEASRAAFAAAAGLPTVAVQPLIASLAAALV
jgi:protein AroM